MNDAITQNSPRNELVGQKNALLNQTINIDFKNIIKQKRLNITLVSELSQAESCLIIAKTKVSYSFSWCYLSIKNINPRDICRTLQYSVHFLLSSVILNCRATISIFLLPIILYIKAPHFPRNIFTSMAQYPLFVSVSCWKRCLHHHLPSL